MGLMNRTIRLAGLKARNDGVEKGVTDSQVAGIVRMVGAVLIHQEVLPIWNGRYFIEDIRKRYPIVFRDRNNRRVERQDSLKLKRTVMLIVRDHRWDRRNHRMGTDSQSIVDHLPQIAPRRLEHVIEQRVIGAFHQQEHLRHVL